MQIVSQMFGYRYISAVSWRSKTSSSYTYYRLPTHSFHFSSSKYLTILSFCPIPLS